MFATSANSCSMLIAASLGAHISNDNVDTTPYVVTNTASPLTTTLHLRMSQIRPNQPLSRDSFVIVVVITLYRYLSLLLWLCSVVEPVSILGSSVIMIHSLI